MLNLIHTAELRRTPTVFLALDAEKAIDRVHWGYLQAVLNKFGLKGFSLSAISAQYSNPSANIFTSNASETFQISNGTRQGCPFSPLIFTLIMEPLAESIRNNPEVKGITVAGQHHKIVLFSDDVVLTLTNPKSSLAAVQNIINNFSNISYYKLNTNKSTVLPINMSKLPLESLKKLFSYT